jgi:hypothetical protein
MSDPSVSDWRKDVDLSTSVMRPANPKVGGPPFRATDTDQYFAYTEEGWTEITQEAAERWSDPDPATVAWRAAMGQSASTELRQTQQALAASQADLTMARGMVVDLDYIIDAFRIESGADRNASPQVGIEAVRRLRGERDEARAEAKEWRAQAELYLTQRDDALHDLAAARFQLRGGEQ